MRVGELMSDNEVQGEFVSDPMIRTVVTILGRTLGDNPSYDEVAHRFPDGETVIHTLLALALQQRSQASRLVVFGTAGSMWDFLIDQLSRMVDGPTDAIDEFRADSLCEHEAAHSVDQGLLDQAAELLAPLLPFDPVFRIHTEARSAEEQVGLIGQLAEVTEGSGVVHFDVTHGFRHLPLLVFAAGSYLRTARPELVIGGVWYAMQTTDRTRADVIDLSGLLQIAEWTEALQRLDWLGDYGAVGGLLENAALAEDLQLAAFRESTHQDDVASPLKRVRSQLQREPLTGAGALFQEVLMDRVSWIDGNLADHQRQQAFNALSRGDYLRAGLYGLEAYVSRLVRQQYPSEKGAIFDHRRREEAVSWIETKVAPSDPRRQDWDELRLIRNRLAHSGAGNDATKQAFASPASLEKALRRLLERLLGRAEQ